MDSESRGLGAGAGDGAEPRRLPPGFGSGCQVALVLAGCVLLAILGAGVGLMVMFMGKAREEARRIRCRGNLNILAKGMATYLLEFGDDRFYPWPTGRAGCGGSGGEADFGGAEWLASLYWTRLMPDPGVFICPSSPDTNTNGEDLGESGCSGLLFRAGPDGKLRPEAVSYAAFGADSVAVWEREKRERAGGPDKRAIKHDFPPQAPMASDDTEGTINHGRAHRGGMSVLFFDSHIEFWTHTKVDLERGVGKGELVALRN